MKQVPIGRLITVLAELEAAKGKRKLAEEAESAAKAQFIEAAGDGGAEFVSETGQKMATVTIQSRTTFAREALLAAGVTEEQLAKAGKVTTSPVLRVH